MDLDGVGVKFQALLGGEKLHHIVTLVALKLDHVAVLLILDDGAIGGCIMIVLVIGLGQPPGGNCGEMIDDEIVLTKLLLDDGEDLLATELLWNSLNSGQGLTSISLCWRSNGQRGVHCFASSKVGGTWQLPRRHVRNTGERG